MTAFEEGKKARLKGKPLDANPHDSDSAAHQEWAEGWKAMNDIVWRKPKPAPDAHLGSSRE